jgi:putative oxidoreductase
MASSSTGDDLGKLLLRVSLGVLILLHGIAKVTGGVDGIVGMVEKIGVPGVFGYLVYVGEIIAPLLLVVGVWTRLAALVVAINMVVAVALVHADELIALTKQGGWALELQGMFFFAALAIALLGAGRYSIGGVRGRFN